MTVRKVYGYIIHLHNQYVYKVIQNLEVDTAVLMEPIGPAQLSDIIRTPL
jgi:hypothetical protein